MSNLTALGWVKFEIEPHCGAERFALVEQYASSRPQPVYALDDGSAIIVNGDKIEVVSEGTWKLFNQIPGVK